MNRLKSKGLKHMTRKRIIAIVLLAVLIVLGVISAYFLYKINVDVVSDITVLNAEGTKGTVLVVYHPGISDFQSKVTHAFANGLTSQGYRVEITTASGQAPTDLSKYRLLVLGSPTYAGNPAPPLSRYLSSLGDLKGKHTVVICTASGNSAVAKMKSAVEDSHGVVVDSLELLTSDGQAEAKAAQEANKLTLP